MGSPQIAKTKSTTTSTASKATTAAAPDPPPRRMIHLKTKEECRLGNELVQIYTVELPSRHAEGILKIIKDNVEGQDALDLQHLRRFAKPKYLPQHVIGERDRVKELYSVPRTWDAGAPAVIQNAASPAWEWAAPGRKRAEARLPTLYLLICPTNVIGLQELHDLMIKQVPFASSSDSWSYPLEIKEITVPRLAPTSPDQAAIWSELYWPTFYRKTNPFGAHPSTIEKAEADLQSPPSGSISIASMMQLADEAGNATEKLGYGVSTGCVIVERVEDQTEIIAVAGDARWKPLPSEGGVDVSLEDLSLEDNMEDEKSEKKGGGGAFAKKTARKKRKKQEQKLAQLAQESSCTSGNVMCHAVMRAIGMVGRKRLRIASQPVSTRAQKAEAGFINAGLLHDEKARDAFFLDTPITPMEQQYFEQDNIKADGYLCLKLEIFLTHEPCMMCSMALVHSRVGRVMFKHRMAETGGLTAEMDSNDSGPVGLGYGLCWRKELNWQFMCWEWTAARRGGSSRAVPGKDIDAMNTARDALRNGRNGHRLNGNDDDEDDEALSQEHESHKHDDEDANSGMNPSLTYTHV
ncbi:hypothetical protein LTR62_007805 [Meristemomyces frigidus]|uniref:CMP/dCMP-type deaminase domain-containing protein n=1 Tax=Meristemomyces frigidus TaxID=1508187 RepID=A0AAN7TLR4_9PEZI|nr:hypothetical protein LTR62_007805 [Meristemomyces frigidus]